MNKTLLRTKDVKYMDELERFELINSIPVPKPALNYLKRKLKNLSIEIATSPQKNIIDLMNDGLLEGWCWETTESAIMFLKDDDCIKRGNLIFSPYKKYWHSWICFKFNNKDFVFDPCLNILCENSIYYYVFETSVSGSVTAKQVRDELIYKINNPKKEVYSKEVEHFFEKFLAPYMSERKKNEIHISGNDDVNSPMYRNNTGYNAVIKDGKIKSLLAHYYLRA